MLFKFKSQAASDLIMLEADARRLLKIILDKDPVQGIVLAQDLPAAMARLEAAVAHDEAMRKQRAAQNKPEEETAERADDGEAKLQEAVSLAQRAAPMLRLLKLSSAQGADVVWGV